MISRIIRGRGTGFAVVLIAANVVRAIPLTAQSPAPDAQQLPAYRTPSIALVQPLAGTALPADRPVVVFRFAPGEAGDPLDISSFRVTVDGFDVTPRFHVTAMEAWGPISDPSARAASEEMHATGTHVVRARVCSSRGACASTESSVALIPAITMPDSTAQRRTARRARLIEVLLDGVKKLLPP